MNLAMELEEAGFFKEHNVAPDRNHRPDHQKGGGPSEMFKETMEKIGEPVAPSKVVETVEDGM